MAYAKSSLLTKQMNRKRSFYQSATDARLAKQQYGLALQEQQIAESEGAIWDTKEKEGREAYTSSWEGFYGEGGAGKEILNVYENLGKKFGFSKKVSDAQSKLTSTGEMNFYENLGTSYMDSDIGTHVYGTHFGKSQIDQHQRAKFIKDLASQGMVSKTVGDQTVTGKQAAFQLYGQSIGKAGTDWYNQNLGGGTWDRGDKLEFKGGRWTRQEHRRGKTKTGLFGIKYWDKDATWWKEHDIHDQIMGTADKWIGKLYTENIWGTDYSLSEIDKNIKTIQDFKASDPYKQFTSDYTGLKTSYDTMVGRGSDYQKAMTRRHKAGVGVKEKDMAMKTAMKQQGIAYKAFKGIGGGMGIGMGLDYQGRKAGYGYGGTA
jgi:hypothetical protein